MPGNSVEQARHVIGYSRNAIGWWNLLMRESGKLKFELQIFVISHY